VIDKVFFEPGYHEITVSEPSGANVLQDNRKYQELSYVLKTGIQEEEFLDTIKRLIHPAGFAVFTEPYIEEMSTLTISPKIEKGNIYYKPLIGNFIAYQINSSVNLRNTGVVNKYDLFPNGYNPVEEKPNQTTPNTYFKHEVGTDGGISDGVELIRFGFLPALPDIDKRNDYWVVYPNLSHLLGSFKKIKDLKIKEVLRILAQRITF
jgi:hypothetical protein